MSNERRSTVLAFDRDRTRRRDLRARADDPSRRVRADRFFRDIHGAEYRGASGSVVVTVNDGPHPAGDEHPDRRRWIVDCCTR